MGYSSTTNPFSDQQMQDALNRAEIEINRKTNTVFLDGTATTPAYTKITDEEHTGKGSNDPRYFLEKYPIPNVSTTVNGTAVGTADTSVFVVDTQGFPTSGYISIESDKITYTGKSGSAFTGVTNISAAHGTAKAVKPYVIEISTSSSGNTPTWTVMEEGDDYDIDLNTGRVYLYDSSLESTANNVVAYTRYPQYQLARRFRANYITGVDNIPADIVRTELMIASMDLMHSAVRKASGAGRNTFSPELINVDKSWIDDTLANYRKSKFQLI